MYNRRLLVFLLVLLINVFLTQPSFGQQATSKQALKGTLIEARINAPALKGNLLGDATEQNITIYLPPGYAASPSKRYPTVYLLHGYEGSNQTWTKATGYNFNAPPILDALMSGGKIREMIIVAPNGKNALDGSFYLNSPVTGNWEDYIVRDVVGYVDANYRTLARPASRGIGGHSMGGFGAVSIGMKHPETFGALYALSPCCLALEGDLHDAKGWMQLSKFTSRDQLTKDYDYMSVDMYAKIFGALSTVFSANPERKPFFADFLYREEGGKLVRDEAVYIRWKTKIPLYMVEDYKQNLLSLRGIFIDVGQKEEFPHIRIATSLFSRALAERDIPHTFEIYEGGTHGNKIRERLERRVFAFFSDTLSFAEPQ